jgi:L-ascorbate metabolism protein UlaG (beta-lactamase superfamily)
MVAEVLKNLIWLGHAAFLLVSGGKAIYFDPFQLPINSRPADIVFISHEHFDHCSPEDVAKIQKAGTVIITDKTSAAKLKGNINVVKPGDQITADGFQVEVVSAYNLNKKFHPQAAGGLGFIVTVDGVRIYHAGDTDFTPDMKAIKADIALLPVSGTYVMTAEEAAEAALTIKPAIAIPMHYGAIVGTESDAQKFQKLLKGKVEVRILPKGK